MKKFLAMAVVFSAAFNSHVMAQTAEETVAFILYGLHEAKINALDIKLQSTSPAIFTETNSGAQHHIHYGIYKIDDCVYRIERSVFTDARTFYMGNASIVDFNKIRVSNELKGGNVSWEIDSDFKCLIGHYRDVSHLGKEPPHSEVLACSHKVDPPNIVSPERLLSAVAHMRKNFCEGRAF